MEARRGYRDCFRMVKLHGGAANRSFLNPPIVVTAVATWERFAVDLAAASSREDWSVRTAGEIRQFDNAPWPVSDKSKPRGTNTSAGGVSCYLDEYLGIAVTDGWEIHLATGWNGQRATQWKVAGFEPLIREAMVGAKFARHAAAHRLPYKQARLARERDGYTWASDNAEKSGTGRPTIQHGYARGVLALFLQLTASSIQQLEKHHSWSVGAQLPSEWFEAKISKGPFEGMELWDRCALVRPE